MMLQPQLKDYVYFARLEQGVYFRGMGQQFVIKNAALYPLIIQILQRMDGQNTVEQMLAVLPAPQQKLLPQLLRQLTQHQMLRDGASINLSTSNMDVSWAPLLRYLADRQPDAPARFGVWQQLHIGISGDSVGVLTAIKALFRQGIHRLTIHLSTDCDLTLAQECAVLVADLVQFNAAANITVHQLDSLPLTDINLLLLQYPAATRAIDLQQADYVSANLADKNFVLNNNPQWHWHQLVGACNYQPDRQARPSRIQQQTAAAVLVQQLIDDWFGLNRDRHLVPCIDISGTVSRHAWQWGNAPASNLQQLRPYLLDPCFGPLQEISQAQLPQIPFQLAQLQLRKTPAQRVTGWGNSITEAEDHALQQALQWLVKAPQTQHAGFDPVQSGWQLRARQWLLQGWQTLQAQSIILDRIEDRQLHQLLNMWRIYHAQMPEVHYIALPDGLLALRTATTETNHYRYAFGKDKTAVLQELLAQLLVPLQLGEFADTQPHAAVIYPDIATTEQSLLWSALPFSPIDVAATAASVAGTTTVPATGKLAGTGIWLTGCDVSLAQEVSNAA